MTSLFTSQATKHESARAEVCGSVVCAQVIGMKPAPQHAINPRDIGGLAL
jgi:hypothetical protein